MAGPALNVGGVYAQAGVHFDDKGFDRFERRLDTVRRAVLKPIRADLKADTDDRDFRRYGQHVDRAQRAARKGANAHLKADTDDRDFRRYDQHVNKAQAQARKGANAHLKADVDERGFKRYEQGLNKADGAAGRSGGRIKGALGAAGAATAGFGAAGVAGFALYAKSAVTTSSDINESLTKNQVLFGKYAKDVDQFSKSSAGSLGISRKAALEAAGTYGNLFTALGVGPKKSADLSVSLTKLASDMASFNNASPDEALEAIRSGLVGEVEPLRKFGVNLNDAQLRQQALSMGLVKTTKEVLPPNIRALAANALITKQTSKAHGDFARTSGGLANQLRIAKARVTDFSGAAGKQLAPTVTRVVKGFNDLVGGSKKGSGAMGGIRRAVAPVVGAFKAAGGGIARFVKDNKDTLGGIAKNFREAFGQVGKIVTGVGKVFKDVFGGGGRGGFGKDLRDIGRVLLQFYKITQDVMLGIAKRLLPPVLTVFKGLALTIRGVVRIIAGIIHGDFRKVFAGLKDIVGGAVRVVVGLIRAMVAPFSGVASKIAHAITGVLGGAFRILVKEGRTALGAMLGVASGILHGFEVMVRGASKIPGVGKKFRGLADDLADTRRGIDKYRESLRNADKDAAKTAGIKKLRGDIGALREKMAGLRKGSSEYKDTAEAVRKKQRQLNDAMVAARASARKGAGGIGTLGDTIANLGVAQHGVIRYTNTEFNAKLKEFGAKPGKTSTKAFEVGQRINPFSSLGGFNRGGGLNLAVPIVASTGEKLVYPDGSIGRVPGNTRVAADTVPMMVPHGTAVLTDQGRALEAGGMGLGDILDRQVPHFARGGMADGIPRFAGGGLRLALGPYAVPPIQYAADHAGGNSHLHIAMETPTLAKAVAAKMQKRGWQISEATWAPGGVQGVHKSPEHYDGRAFDGNTAQDETRAQVAGVAALLKTGKYGSGAGAFGGGALGDGAPAFVPIKAPKFAGFPPPIIAALGGMGKKLVGAANDKLEKLAPAGSSGTSGSGVPAGFHGANRALGKRMAGDFKSTWGRGPEWEALDDIWGHLEGSWDEGVSNYAGSGAYGIAQALPASKYPAAGQPSAPGGLKKAAAQIGWGLRYISGRYGDPIGAHAARLRQGWYRGGGQVAGGIGRFVESFRGGGTAGGLNLDALTIPGSSNSAVGSDGLMTSAGASRTRGGSKVITKIKGNIDQLGTDYDHASRRFDLSTEEFVIEGTETTPPKLNKAAIAKRANEITRLMAIRKRIVAKYRSLHRYAESLKKIYSTMIARLQVSIRAVKVKIARLAKGKESKSEKKELDAARDRLGKFTKALGGAREKFGTYDEESRTSANELDSSKIDYDELVNERKPLLAGGKGVELPDWQAPDAGGALSGDLGADPGLDLGADTGLDFAAAGDTGTAPATQEEIAAAARQEVDAFQSSRSALFAGAGANYEARGGPGLGNLGGAGGLADQIVAAGVRNFGAFGAAGGQGPGGPAVQFVQNVEYREQPHDPHIHAQTSAFELRAAFR